MTFAKGWPIVAWGVGYVVAGVLLAALSAWPIYAGPWLIAPAAGGCMLGAGLVLLARWFRWGVVWTGLAAVAVYLLAVVPLAVPSAMSSPGAAIAGVRDGVTGIVLGWKQLLTLSLPVGQYQAVLVPFFAFVFVGTIAAVALAIRTDRVAPAAVVIVVAMALFGVVFGSSATSAPLDIAGVAVPAPRELGIGIGVVLLSLAWLVGRARLIRSQAIGLARAEAGTVRRRRASAWLGTRRGVVGGVILVAAVAGGLAIAPAAAGLGPREALREAVDPVVVVRQQPSPLSSYRSWFTASSYDTELLRIDGDVDRIRIASLAAYDGQEFHVGSADGDVLFSRLPQAAVLSPGRTAVQIEVGEGYRGIWLPAPAGLVAAPVFAGSRSAALADGFYVDQADGAAIDVAAGQGARGLAPGDRYRVIVSRAAAPVLAPDAEGGDALIDGDDYPALAEWVELQSVPRTGQGLIELIDRLRARGYLSHALSADAAAGEWIAALQSAGGYSFLPSRAGHSAARIDELFRSLVDQQNRAGSGASDDLLVSAVGDDEQFSAAAALLARYLGFDSRVVVGIRPAGDADAGIPACTDVCTGASMAAWVEVRAGGEWAPLDVSPQFSRPPTEIAEGEKLPENPTVPDRVTSDVVDPPRAQNDDAAAAGRPSADAADPFGSLLPVLRAAGLALAAVVLLLLPVITLLAGKAMRSRGRRRMPPEASVVAAWEELADALSDSGVPLPVAPTRAAAAALSGRPRAVQLATAVDRAVFSSRPVTIDDADAAWELVDAERAELRDGLTPIARWRTRLRPASVVRSFTWPSLTRARAALSRKESAL